MRQLPHVIDHLEQQPEEICLTQLQPEVNPAAYPAKPLFRPQISLGSRRPGARSGFWYASRVLFCSRYFHQPRHIPSDRRLHRRGKVILLPAGQG